MRFAWPAAVAALLVAATCGAEYPTRPVRIVATVPPDGAPDIVARLLAERLSPALEQPVIVENKPGLNGSVAAEAVAKSAPDGHTLLAAHDSVIVINPHLYRRMPIDVQRDLAPVCTIASSTFTLSVNPSLPAHDLAQFVALARNAEPPLTYGSGGIGSQHHLMMEWFKSVAGINLVHVPYRGGAFATSAAAAGEVAAVSIADTYPEFRFAVWSALFAPAGTPNAVLLRLRKEIAAILASAGMRERLRLGGGLRPFITSPDEFAALMRRDSERYRGLIARLGLTVD